MGVLGLWQLLNPVGQPVTLESLENKILSVDISIWLNQAIKGYRDAKGGAVTNAHLLSLFSRLCKLLFYKIRPIIVFDGGVPELKKQTVITRYQRRSALKQGSKDAGLKLLANYVASRSIEKSRTKDTKSSISPSKSSVRDDLYILPPLEESLDAGNSEENNNELDFLYRSLKEDEVNYLSEIDIESQDFDVLPADIKQEILSTLKENHKHKKSEYYDALPKESEEFSNYQMQGLLKRRRLQSKMEEIQKNVQKTHYLDIISLYADDENMVGVSSRVMSDECSHYVLLKKTAQETSSGGTNVCDNSTNVQDDLKRVIDDDIIEVIDMPPHTKQTKVVETKVLNDYYSLQTNSDEEEVECIDTGPSYESVSNNIHDKSNYTTSNTDNISSSLIDVEYDCKTKDKLTSESSKLSRDVDTQLQLEVNQVDVESYKCKNDNEYMMESSVILSNSSDCESLASVPELDSDKFYNNCSKSSNLNYEVPTSLPKATSMANKSSTVLNNSTELNSNMCIGSSSDKHKEQFDHQLIQENDNISTERVPETIPTLRDELSQIQLAVQKELQESTSTLQAQEANKKEDEIHLVVQKEIQESTLPLQAQEANKKQEEIHLAIQKEIQESTLTPQVQEANKKQEEIHLVVQKEIQESTLPLQAQEANKKQEEINLSLQKELQESTLKLQAEQAKNERQASTVLDHMIEDCKEMLRLFGVPYIVSPMEAEAQCAFFDHQGVTQGTITDDSDIWLFGGKRVYKNFFAQKKYVEFYNSTEILAHFGLTRFKLINFAMLTGSDYTEGIDGVGPVTAMEIISEFSEDGIDALYAFKAWWEELQKHASPPKNKVRAKLKQLPVPSAFPNQTVFEAYVDPKIDDSTESFSWGLPDLDALRDYAREKFGWNKSKVDDALLPVLKRLKERTAQTHLDSFFTIRLKKEKNLFPSKRVMSALKKIIPGEEEEGDDPKPKVLKKTSSVSGKDSNDDPKPEVSKKKSSKQKPLKKKEKKASNVKRTARFVNKAKVKQVLQLSEDSSSD